MARTNLMFIVAGALLIGALAAGFGDYLGFYLFLACVVVFAIAILLRPREIAARRLAAWEASVATWGEGIGPGPGEDGVVIPPAAFPPTLSRAYRERSDADIKRIRALDAAQLASRGFFPISEGFVPGQWRPIDWLVAILFGLIWVVFLLVVKPAGTVTVIYGRAAGQPPTPWAHPVPASTATVAPAVSPAPTAVARLASLDQLRQAGLIDDDEWKAKRADIIGAI